MEQTKGPWVFYLKDYHWSILLTLSYALTITRDVLLLGQEQLFLCRIALRAKIYLTISGSIKGSFNRIRKVFLESRAFGPSGLYLLWSSRLLMHSYELDFASTIKNNKHLGFWSFFENLMNTRNTKKVQTLKMVPVFDREQCSKVLKEALLLLFLFLLAWNQGPKML